MCLAIPGKLLELTDDAPFTRSGRVSFNGIIKHVNLAYVPEAHMGDYVIVHVGFAISTLDEAEAERVFAYLREMDELRELEEVP
jgi:hydrogenase expression/formation protein HypC